MTHDEADRMLASLRLAGVSFEWFAFTLPGRDPLPDGTDYAAMEPGSWDAELAPMWPILPETDPNAAAVDEAWRRWYADPAFAEAIGEAYFREQEREDARADTAAMWEVPGP